MSKRRVDFTLAPFLPVLLFLVAPPQPALAQVLRGVVRDSSANQGIAHARITLLNEAGETVAVAHSGDSGAFVTGAPVFGVYTVSVVRIGFRPIEDGPLMLLPNDTVQAVYYMDPLPVALDPVIVKAEAYVQYLEDEGFYTREKKAFGYHLGPEFIERRLTASTRVADFMSAIPGVRVLQGGVGAGRQIALKCGLPTYYVDDVRYLQDAILAGLDELVEPHDVLAIEVYDGQLGSPAQYGTCAVVIWTRFKAERVAEGRGRSRR
jgi:hypothetical protein